MNNIWRVYTRDVGRLLRVPVAWIIIVGLVITPALYAWLNIIGFWDPYGRTGHIRVGVANLDTGAHSDVTGEVDVGSQVVEELRGNDQLDWQFVGPDEALDHVRSGDYFAAIIIPEDFSRDLVSITSGDFVPPELEYYVNEKANAIAPKVTDVGATSIETQINSTFTSTLARAVTDAVKGEGREAQTALTDAENETLTALDDAQASVDSAHRNLEGMQSGLAESRQRVKSAQDTLTTVDRELATLQTALGQGQTIVTEAQRDAIAFTDSMTSVFVQGSGLLADSSSRANASISALTTGVLQANGGVAGSIDDARQVATANGEATERLQKILDGADVDPEAAARLNELLTALRERNDDDQDTLDGLQTLNDDSAATAAAVADASDSINTAVRGTADSADSMRTILLDTIPALNSGLSELSSGAGGTADALAAQRRQVAQAQSLLGDLDTQLVDTSRALDRVSASLDTLDKDLDTVRTDLVALSTSAAWDELKTLTGLDAEQIADFMASPVDVDQQVVFPVGTYGSAMAALFTNLSLWIGAFMQVVLVKLEVDREGVEGLTLGQAYLGRWLLLAGISIAQALVVSAGNIVIGVQMVSTAAFVATAVVVALTYLSIIYALALSFGHVGKGLCVVLVIVQIPGASGLYPIEMMPPFFRALYPLFPFTYGINALRETIAGFYDAHYWHYLARLGIFVTLAFILGLGLRRGLGNLHEMFSTQIRSTGLLVGERAQNTGGGYRLTQVLHALADKEEYRQGLERRAASFTRNYPRLLRGALIAGLIVPVVLGMVSSLSSAAKAVVLGMWVAWTLLIVGFLVVVEYVRDSIGRQLAVGDMGQDDLLHLLLARSTVARLGVRGKHGKGGGVRPGGVPRRASDDEAGPDSSFARQGDGGSPGGRDAGPGTGRHESGGDGS